MIWEGAGGARIRLLWDRIGSDRIRPRLIWGDRGQSGPGVGLRTGVGVYVCKGGGGSAGGRACAVPREGDGAHGTAQAQCSNCLGGGASPSSALRGGRGRAGREAAAAAGGGAVRLSPRPLPPGRVHVLWNGGRGAAALPPPTHLPKAGPAPTKTKSPPAAPERVG